MKQAHRRANHLNKSYLHIQKGFGGEFHQLRLSWGTGTSAWSSPPEARAIRAKDMNTLGLFSKNPDRSHSRLLPSALVRLFWNIMKLVSRPQANTKAFIWTLFKVFGCLFVCEVGIFWTKFGHGSPLIKLTTKKGIDFSCFFFFKKAYLNVLLK